MNYPITKECPICLKPFECKNRWQVARKKTCSPKCASISSASKNEGGMPMEERPGMVLINCALCGRPTWKPKAWLKRVKQSTCSKHCNGVLRGRERRKKGT